jgi:hypothetical protein
MQTRGSQRDVVYANRYSALVYEPKCGGRGLRFAGSQPMSTAVVCTRSPINFGDLQYLAVWLECLAAYFEVATVLGFDPSILPHTGI